MASRVGLKFLVEDVVYSGFELCISSGWSPNDVSPDTAWHSSICA